jgi:hypothetical protein
MLYFWVNPKNIRRIKGKIPKNSQRISRSLITATAIINPKKLNHHLKFILILLNKLLNPAKETRQSN